MDSCSSSPPPPALLPVSHPLLSLSRNCEFVCMVVCSAFVSASGLPAQEEKATPSPQIQKGEAAPGAAACTPQGPGCRCPGISFRSHCGPRSPERPWLGLLPPASPSRCDLRGGPSLRRGLDRCSPLGPSSTWKTSLPRETRGRQWPGRGVGGGESDEVSSS